MDRYSERHSQTAECKDEHCLIHSICERSFPGVSYQECGECGHVFQTAQELLNANNDVIREMRESAMSLARYESYYSWIRRRIFYLFSRKGFQYAKTVDEIYICPHCSHDF